MPAPTIHHPGNDAKIVTTSGAFAVFGTADVSLVGITGSCQSAAGDVYEGTIIRTPGTEPGHHRWAIVFHADVAAGDTLELALSVAGRTAEGVAVPAAPVTFRIHRVQRTAGVSLSWPATGSPSSPTSVTVYRTDFTPYGNLTSGVPLQSVTLYNSTDKNYVGLIYSYSDATDYDIWTAQFATLPSGKKFTLTATDQGGNSMTSWLST